MRDSAIVITTYLVFHEWTRVGIPLFSSIAILGGFAYACCKSESSFHSRLGLAISFTGCGIMWLAVMLVTVATGPN